MPLIVANGKRIFFAHVPKTGESSVEGYQVCRFGYTPPDPSAYPPDPKAALRWPVARIAAHGVVRGQRRHWLR